MQSSDAAGISHQVQFFHFIRKRVIQGIVLLAPASDNNGIHGIVYDFSAAENIEGCYRIARYFLYAGMRGEGHAGMGQTLVNRLTVQVLSLGAEIVSPAQDLNPLSPLSQKACRIQGLGIIIIADDDHLIPGFDFSGEHPPYIDNIVSPDAG